MSLRTEQRTEYGNWLSRRFLCFPGVTGLALGLLSFIFPVLALPTAALFLCFLYFVYARNRFSLGGGDLQSKVQDLLLQNLDWDGTGKVIDIGCGNGPLAIAIARKYPSAEVTGIDYWGGKWEYSKAACERNAVIEGVSSRVAFQRASASSLPFDDGAFDVAVSNLVFHEVRDTSDKKQLIREALRVVRKGGKFVFQDLFLWKLVYGETDQLLDTIRSWGVESVDLEASCNSEFIPKALKLPFMLGTLGILHGTR